MARLPLNPFFLLFKRPRDLTLIHPSRFGLWGKTKEISGNVGMGTAAVKLGRNA